VPFREKCHLCPDARDLFRTDATLTPVRTDPAWSGIDPPQTGPILSPTGVNLCQSGTNLFPARSNLLQKIFEMS
jgi:hypothetical protein